MRIVWTEISTKHLESAYEYWAIEGSLTAADTMLERIFSAVEMLEDYPEAGRPGRVSGTRELVVLHTPFVVTYRVHRDNIQILALLHGARKWPENF